MFFKDASKIRLEAGTEAGGIKDSVDHDGGKIEEGDSQSIEARSLYICVVLLAVLKVSLHGWPEKCLDI